MGRTDYGSIANEFRKIRVGRQLSRSMWVILLCSIVTTTAAQDAGVPTLQTVPPAPTPEPAATEQQPVAPALDLPVKAETASGPTPARDAQAVTQRAPTHALQSKMAAAVTPGRHAIAPLIEVGWYNGVVGGMQLDAGAVGVRASGGYFPIVLLVSDRWRPAATIDLELINSVQANGELLWFFAAPAERSRVGLSVGYHYNTVLKHGAGLAFEGEVGLSDAVTLFYTFGLAVYWKGNDHARDELRLSNASFNFPFGAGFQGGAGVGLKFPL